MKTAAIGCWRTHRLHHIQAWSYIFYRLRMNWCARLWFLYISSCVLGESSHYLSSLYSTRRTLSVPWFAPHLFIHQFVHEHLTTISYTDLALDPVPQNVVSSAIFGSREKIIIDKHLGPSKRNNSKRHHPVVSRLHTRSWNGAFENCGRRPKQGLVSTLSMILGFWIWTLAHGQFFWQSASSSRKIPRH